MVCALAVGQLLGVGPHSRSVDPEPEGAEHMTPRQLLLHYLDKHRTDPHAPEKWHAAIVAMFDEREADAERYRYLRAGFSPMGLNIDGNHAWAYRRNATLKGPNLDAAIDAARAKEVSE